MLSVSPTAIVVAFVAPLATLHGLVLLGGRGGVTGVRVTLGGTVFNVVSVRWRLAGVVFDLLSVGELVVLLLLMGPLFPPLSLMIPLSPVAYLWSGNARGSTLG
ncbi:MAG: hypothetical protein EXR66_02500 [Dehalococcoidia bacterium]|nr:hypothetical protein [Dehalococcoidia bacterium]